MRSTADGRLVRLQDVARVELGAQDYVTNSYLNGKPAVALGDLPAARHQCAGRRRRRSSRTMDELKQNFPPGLDYQIVYNPTEFIAESR